MAIFQKKPPAPAIIPPKESLEEEIARIKTHVAALDEELTEAIKTLRRVERKVYRTPGILEESQQAKPQFFIPRLPGMPMG
jgi:hypothetical protein